jgi:hypothetical protein
MTNETKQTAVEWLVEKINEQKAWANPQQLKPLIKQAKKIEQEQSVKFALYYAFGEQEVSEDLKINIEKLYNETYGGNK